MMGGGGRGEVEGASLKEKEKKRGGERNRLRSQSKIRHLKAVNSKGQRRDALSGLIGVLNKLRFPSRRSPNEAARSE